MPALTYRDFQASDFEDLHAIVSHWEVARNLGSWPWPPEPEFTRSRCRPYVGDGFAWAICTSDKVIGSISLTNGVLGYMLAPDYQGQGIMQQAVRHVLDHGFADPACNAVTAQAWADNAISIHILEKLGFVLEGESYAQAKARKAQTLDKQFRLTRAAWAATRAAAARAMLPIQTDRLTLKNMTEADAADLHRIVVHPDVGPMLFRFPPDWTVAEATAFIDETPFQGRAPFRLGVYLEDRLIGTVGTGDEIPTHVIYFIDPAYHGQGYGREAMAGLIRFMFKVLGHTELGADAFNDNPASLHVLRRLGFAEVGQDMGYSAARPNLAPMTLFRMTRAAWQDLSQPS